MSDWFVPGILYYDVLRRYVVDCRQLELDFNLRELVQIKHNHQLELL